MPALVELLADDAADPLDEELFAELPEEELLEGLAEDEAVALLPELDWSALCTAAESSVLTRFKAVWLAMLERPLDKLVTASPMTLISAESADVAWAWFCC